MPTVVLVRHGETPWNRDERMQGWAPVPLSERGHEQAAAAAAFLADDYDVDRVVASDLLRTRETAESLREALDDPPVEFDRAWRERDIGVYQGLSYRDMLERFPTFGLGEAAAHAATEVPDGGESIVEMRDRVLDGFRTVAGESGTTLVVTHGGPIHQVLGHAKGMDVTEAVLEHTQANCAVNEFDVDGETVTVRRENATPWEEGEDGVEPRTRAGLDAERRDGD
ncbi:histidine phosphatase family protein [Halomarina oriensis]|uniref:Histidine phosphatase family protein n=1 Tax=Halomarina oriensis TaxID=671145 RepID=A0A6B0GLI3_9EURY|nr:histidine phosphatase family protein [Halomarina oriensis]MWG34741.1 histidine phosphatase family protein [Halomarina oriensis]